MLTKYLKKKIIKRTINSIQEKMINKNISQIFFLKTMIIVICTTMITHYMDKNRNSASIPPSTFFFDRISNNLEKNFRADTNQTSKTMFAV